MFCPSCGSEERQLSQYCRGCGTDLRIVRTSLERPDAITASAISAREQISRAVAEKISQLKSAKDLAKVAEDVLPYVEKFIESPAEKRLRRVRAGVITAAIGFGITFISFLMTMAAKDFFPLILPGFITFMIGIGVIINGFIFTVPRKELPGDGYNDFAKNVLGNSGSVYEAPAGPTNELGPARVQTPSITEHTTHHLNNKR
jgi:hypothetical protein